MKIIVKMDGAKVADVERVAESRASFGDMTSIEIRQYDRAHWQETPWPLWDEQEIAYDLQLRRGHQPPCWTDCERARADELKQGDQVSLFTGRVETVEQVSVESDTATVTFSRGKFEFAPGHLLARVTNVQQAAA